MVDSLWVSLPVLVGLCMLTILLSSPSLGSSRFLPPMVVVFQAAVVLGILVVVVVVVVVGADN
jgi:hypothetical protein